jgi:hypothetical protein
MVMKADRIYLDWAESRVSEFMAMYRLAQETNEWPGVMDNNAFENATIPEWAVQEEIQLTMGGEPI